MRALLKKELHGLLPETVISGFLGGAGLIAVGRFAVDWGPPGHDVGDGITIYAMTMLLTGAALGFWQLYTERKEGTDAYLIHRATGAAGAFQAKLLAGWISLSLLVVMVLAIHALWFALFSPAGPLARWERAWQHLALSTLIFSGYGLGLWTSALPRAESTRFLMLLLACSSSLALSSLVSLRWNGGPSAPVLRFALVQIALAAAFTWQARRTYLSGVEPERPLGGRLALWNVPLALVGLALPFALLQSSLQKGLRGRILSNREHIVQAPDGELFLAGRFGRFASGFVRFDQSGLPVSEELLRYTGWGRGGGEDYWTVFHPDQTPLAWSTSSPPPLRRLFVGKPFELSSSWLHIRGLGWPNLPWRPTAWLDQASGWVHAAESIAEEPVAMHRLGKGSSSERFSRSTMAVFPSEGSGACLVDRSDASAWRLEGQGAGTRMVPAPLPEGERLIDVERVHSLWRIHVGLYEPFGVSDTLVARGERGHWSWTDTGWVPYEGWPGSVLESQAPAAIELRVRNANGDGLAPRIEVLDARTGDVRFAHDYLPRTGVQKLALLGAQVLAVLRPPLASLPALRQDASAPERMRRPLDKFVLDPALAGGHRAWLAVLGFLLALAMAATASRHLGRSGSDRPLRLLWIALVAVLGLPAFVACCFVEPQRLRQPATRQRQSAAEGARGGLLIASGP